MDGFPSLFAIESSSAFGFSSAFSITSTERYDMCQHESFLRNLCNLPIFRDSVDASELLLRLVGLSHDLQGFTTIPGIPAGCLGFLPSAWWDSSDRGRGRISGESCNVPTPYGAM